MRSYFFPLSGKKYDREGRWGASLLAVALISGMRKEVRPHGEMASLAAAQHGVVSHAQLMDLGYSTGAIARALEARRLHRLHRGAEVTPEGPSAFITRRSSKRRTEPSSNECRRRPWLARSWTFPSPPRKDAWKACLRGQSGGDYLTLAPSTSSSRAVVVIPAASDCWSPRRSIETQL